MCYFIKVSSVFFITLLFLSCSTQKTSYPLTEVNVTLEGLIAEEHRELDHLLTHPRDIASDYDAIRILPINTSELTIFTQRLPSRFNKWEFTSADLASLNAHHRQHWERNAHRIGLNQADKPGKKTLDLELFFIGFAPIAPKDDGIQRSVSEDLFTRNVGTLHVIYILSDSVTHEVKLYAEDRTVVGDNYILERNNRALNMRSFRIEIAEWANHLYRYL